MTNLKNLLTRLVMRFLACAVVTIVISSEPTFGQAFSSGSDGSDGALNVPSNSGAIIFDPFDVARWGRVLDPDGDGVYNFTTITIGNNTTVELKGNKVNQPLHWLASGNVVIDGFLRPWGIDGVATTDLAVRRQVSVPGSGGYAGGAGGIFNTPIGATPGEGPGGGVGTFSCASRPGSNCGNGGRFTGNRYLIPLVGGSGGAGSLYDLGSYFGGGAGAGAILIASSTSISVNGEIRAQGGGGANNNGGGGSGGAIRLVAPVLSGNGTLDVRGGPGGGGQGNGSPGWIRLEGFVISNTCSTPAAGAVSRGTPGHASTMRPASSVRVTAVDGIPIAPNPSGTFQVPDVVIEKGEPVSLDIEASGIPPGTVVTLRVYPEVPVDETTVYLPAVDVTLSGTLQSSSGTGMFAFPFGFSRCYIQATWGQ